MKIEIKTCPDTYISEPGFYADVPMKRYHGDLCGEPSVSRSVINTAWRRCAKRAWHEYYLNEKAEVDDGQGPGLRMGTAAHALMFDNDEFDKTVVVCPEDSFRTNAAKKWRADAIAARKTYLSKAEYAQVLGMAESLVNNPLARTMLAFDSAVRELTMVWRDEKTGLWVKARPDVSPLSGVGCDLKTCADASPRALQRAVRENGYDVQAALCSMAYEAITGKPIEHWGLVFVESSAPHVVEAYQLGKNQLWRGRVIARAGLDYWAECLRSGDFPGYVDYAGVRGDDIKTLDLQDWEVDQIKADQNAGILPTNDQL